MARALAILLLAAAALSACSALAPCPAPGPSERPACLLWVGCGPAPPPSSLTAGADALCGTAVDRTPGAAVAIDSCGANGTAYHGAGVAAPPLTALNASCVSLPGLDLLAGPCASQTAAYYAWSRLDRCGVCGGSDACLGCDGVPYSGLKVDGCGACGGDNGTCASPGCTPGKYRDVCGVCGGNNATCTDPGCPAGQRRDACGDCGGASIRCRDCAGTPRGQAMYDSCFVCGGPGRSPCGLCRRSATCALPADRCAMRVLLFNASSIAPLLDALPPGRAVVSSDRVTNGGGTPEFHGVAPRWAWDVVATLPLRTRDQVRSLLAEVPGVYLPSYVYHGPAGS